MSVDSAFDHIRNGVQERFRQSDRLRSFHEFLDDFLKSPGMFLRTAPQYLFDMVEHLGTRESSRVGQEARHFRVFDRDFASGEPPLAGQERVQEALYQRLQAFAKRGKAERMLLLHGPNGSGKTTIVESLCSGLEHYSRTDEGVLLTFNWIFTDREGRLETIGFDKEAKDLEELDSYAHVDQKDVTSRISCELRDHPIFLIPKRFRKRFIEEAIESCPPASGPRYPYEYYLDGELSQKSKKIYDTLLVAYQGDWRKVVRHVQVERFFISRRFRRGTVSIEPQGNVDASVRPIQHESAWSIPPLLRNVSLYELVGDIIDSNRGLLEYSDFLKRPLEASKYLLTTCERGTVSLANCMAYLDLVIFATTNEKQLSVFKRNPDFSSFKGRIELIPVPYLLRYSVEADLYRRHLTSYVNRSVAPHAAEVAALWATLTRLRRPKANNYEGRLAQIVTKLSPIEKAKLYDSGEAPNRFSEEERKLLKANVLTVRQEFEEAEGEFEGIYGAEYEGRRGASPREMVAVLDRASEMNTHECITPMAVFDALTELIKDSSVHDFLRIPADAEYHDVRGYINGVREEYIHWVTEEVYDAIQLIDEGEYSRFFHEYFRHVKAFHTGESVYNSGTNSYDSPNEELMNTIESLLSNTEVKETFRSEIITRIAAWSLDHPQEKLDYQGLFPEIYSALRENFYKERDRLLTLIEQDILKYGTDEFDLLNDTEKLQVRKALTNMEEKHGYCKQCAREVIAYVLQYRGHQPG